jgi:hypothetical protein
MNAAEKAVEAEMRKQEQFFALAKHFCHEKYPEAAKRLGDELGRMVFGGDAENRFGSFKICGSGPYPKTFLFRGQVARGEALL